MKKRVKVRLVHRDHDGLIDTRTEPCRRCGSFNTRVLGREATGEIFLRLCLSCRFKWDYQPEFAPRRRKLA